MDFTASLTSSLQIRRQWLSSGYSATYEVNGNLSNGILSDFIDLSIRLLIPAEVFDQKILSNIKGRDALNLIHSEIPESHKPNGDEIAYVYGTIGSLSHGNHANSRHNQFPIHLRVNTTFHQFEGSHIIQHKSRIDHFGDYSHDVPLRFAGRVFPFQPHRFRLGLDFFESKFLSSMFGFAPTVRQTLLIEADENRFNVRIVAEDLKSKASLPLAKGSLLKQLDQVFRQLFSFSIEQDYLSRTKIN